MKATVTTFVPIVGRTYGVLGLGRSGLAVCKALIADGANILAWDDSAEACAAAEIMGAKISDFPKRSFDGVAALIVSPGIPILHPAPHPIVARAREAGVEIVGDIDLLASNNPDATYIGITGTNGKSTTTSLVGHILKVAGRQAEVGGNLGLPALALDNVGGEGIYVLELSSYQLELSESAVFDIAVLLNISPDHLDRHGGMDGYVAAKKRIFQNQSIGSIAIVGVDDAQSRAVYEELKGRSGLKVIAVSGREAQTDGVYAVGRTLFDATGEGPAESVLDLSRVRALPGEHNAQNAAAAYAVARAAGISSAETAAAITDFPGLAHRQELVDVIDGISYINDSKATNAEAAARALACYDNVYWIAGGRPKADGINSIRPHLERVRHAYLIGEAANDFQAALQGLVETTVCGELPTALERARIDAMAEADQGDGAAVILLSPACASFDQFRDFEDRGNAFRSLVGALAGANRIREVGI